MKMDTIEEWDLLYENADPIPPSRVLSENVHLLSNSGRALEIACGLAENSFLLARQGYQVDAYDNSRVAINRVNKKAANTSLSVKAEIKDVINCVYPTEYYDAIVLTHFLEQSISSKIVASLKPGGLLFYQTFTREQVSACGPEELKYRLKSNEVFDMFPELSIVVYREEGRLGDVNQGFRNEAFLVAKKL